MGMPKTWVIAVLGVVLAGMGANRAGQYAKSPEPEKVTVQHLLISFKGRLPEKQITRKRPEAEALARSLMERVRNGEDFDALVKQYTDDRYPGIYVIVNDGAPLTSGTVPRDRMAMSFGDVAFSLEVGEVGMTKYHSFNSPYGWHIIKRLE
jgi:parvulin-like peptidyl-prolyl isomerase